MQLTQQALEARARRGAAVSCLVSPNDDIHEMNNVSDRDTVEIHIYGKDLTDMPRLRFDLATKTDKTFDSPKYDNC